MCRFLFILVLSITTLVQAEQAQPKPQSSGVPSHGEATAIANAHVDEVTKPSPEEVLAGLSQAAKSLRESALPLLEKIRGTQDPDSLLLANRDAILSMDLEARKLLAQLNDAIAAQKQILSRIELDETHAIAKHETGNFIANKYDELYQRMAFKQALQTEKKALQSAREQKDEGKDGLNEVISQREGKVKQLQKGLKLLDMLQALHDTQKKVLDVFENQQFHGARYSYNYQHPTRTGIQEHAWRLSLREVSGEKR